MTSVFLSVYTPTYKRPKLLEQCENSVRSQTIPIEQIIIRDDIGIGIAGVYADIPKYSHYVTGEYVMVLSDDNVLEDENFASELEVIANDFNPDVIVFKGKIEGIIQPLIWEREPEICHIDLSCFAVRREIWQKHASDWGHRYEGDFDFIHKLWTEWYSFYWWDRIGFRALKISHGEPE